MNYEKEQNKNVYQMFTDWTWKMDLKGQHQKETTELLIRQKRFVRWLYVVHNNEAVADIIQQPDAWQTNRHVNKLFEEARRNNIMWQLDNQVDHYEEMHQEEGDDDVTWLRKELHNQELEKEGWVLQLKALEINDPPQPEILTYE